MKFMGKPVFGFMAVVVVCSIAASASVKTVKFHKAERFCAELKAGGSASEDCVNALVESLNELQSAPLVSFMISPAVPRQGDTVTVYMRLSSAFELSADVRTFISAKYDNADINLLRPTNANNLWLYRTGPFVNVGSHKIQAAVSVENFKESRIIRAALVSLNQEIIQLETQIAHENDPGRKAVLMAECDQKLSQKNALQAALLRTKKMIGDEEFNFIVSANENSESVFPAVTGVTPGYGPKSGGTNITISGRKFTATTKLKIGGIEVTPIFVDAVTLLAVTPQIAATGPVDVEIEDVRGADVMSSVLKNAFYAIEPNGGSGSDVNRRPVAFAGVPQKVQAGKAVVLDGGLSYDEDPGDQDVLTYTWSFVSKPLDSQSVIQADPLDKAKASFVTDANGSYVVSLVVSDGRSNSVPSLTVVDAPLGVYVRQDPLVITKASGNHMLEGSYPGFFSLLNLSPAETLRVKILGYGGDQLPLEEFNTSPSIGEEAMAAPYNDLQIRINYLPSVSNALVEKNVIIQTHIRDSIEFDRELHAVLRTAPFVTMLASSTETTEGGTPVVITVTRTDASLVPLSQPLRVEYSLSGVAGNGIDYVALPGFVEIPAGQPSADIQIVAIDDSTARGDRWMMLQFPPGTNYFTGRDDPTAMYPHVLYITIRDNDTKMNSEKQIKEEN